ncbi:MAG: glycosyltransferase family 2 protein [Lachnospiraceae bacterium]|nr:glycosyltransferase family 2 protein [Lachnospiraceae bacterium]
MTTCDIIVPCYNEEEVLHAFYRETHHVTDSMKNYSFTYIFVDDGSRDHTLPIMRELAEQNPDVRYISFSRNFGKEAAMYAGLTHSTGDLVIIMDADLQHPPAMIPTMMEGIEEGYDCAAARRLTRDKGNGLQNLFSSTFYKISNMLTEVKMPQNAVDFRIMRRPMVDAILKLSEVERFSKGIFAWVGYETKWYPYENVERTLGTTKWSFRALLRYAMSGITAFSVAPLKLLSGLGIFMCGIAFVYTLTAVICGLIPGVSLGDNSALICVLLWIGGILELSMGVLGEYMTHIYREAKDRPVYLIRQTNIVAGSDNK